MSSEQKTEQATEEKKIVEIKPDGIVLYTDGGAAPSNPGYGGSGVHGYTYSNEYPKKGTGNSDVRLTTGGYIANSEVTDQQPITPLQYIDWVKSYKDLITNNAAELNAGLMALEYIIVNKIPYAVIHSDSTYFVEGSKDWVEVWKQNGWKRRNGTPIPNLEIWIKISQYLEVIRNNKQELRISHIYGHAGFIGNELADRLATIGVLKSKNREFVDQCNIYPTTKYWDKNSYTNKETNTVVKVEKHPLFSLPRLVFTTHAETQLPGLYLLASAVKDDELSLIGSADPQKSLSVIHLETPEPLVEQFIEYQTQFALDIPSIVLARLDYLLKNDVYIDLMTYGIQMLEKTHPLRLDLYSLDQQPVSRELKPPRKAQWEMDEFDNLYKKLLSFKERNEDLIVTDITEVLYDIEPTKDGKDVKHKLKEQYNVGFTHFDTTVEYHVVDGSEMVNCRLTMGIDLPDRNTLKRLESYSPKVSVITWQDEPPQEGRIKSYRVAVVIEVKDGIGIWAGVYSNLRIVNI